MREGGRERENERVNFCMSAPGHLHCGAQHAKRQQRREGKNNLRRDGVRFFLFFLSIIHCTWLSWKLLTPQVVADTDVWKHFLQQNNKDNHDNSNMLNM